MTLSEKINATGPKRILGLDGEGIQGIITLEILARIEGHHGFALVLLSGAHESDFAAALPAKPLLVDPGIMAVNRIWPRDNHPGILIGARVFSIFPL